MIEVVMAMMLAAQEPEEVTVAGPDGPLAGTLSGPAEGPAMVLIPGSGPTDRDGDNMLALKGKVFVQLADALNRQGIAVLRYDKRGMFGSAAAIANGNDVTLDAYADDARAFVDLLRDRGRDCVWLAGHSEGGVVALTEAARNPEGLCGVLLLATPGRPLLNVIESQLDGQIPEAWMELTVAGLDALRAGETFDVETLPAPLRPMFNPSIQPYLIDLGAADPAALAGRVAVPMLIVSLGEDVQVMEADADALSAGQPGATRVDIPGVNHAFKPVRQGATRMENIATYADADLTIDPAVATAIAAFIKAE
ncbi:alpha/beta fold hydrolase [Sphingomicrobium sp. XHP0239]|uniref:alpha/beta hydrolase n=1 Tax=Sphingomicrobium maritimum TaxID=3133972 RepID=UPI0031CC431A